MFGSPDDSLDPTFTFWQKPPLDLKFQETYKQVPELVVLESFQNRPWTSSFTKVQNESLNLKNQKVAKLVPELVSSRHVPYRPLNFQVHKNLQVQRSTPEKRDLPGLSQLGYV